MNRLGSAQFAKDTNQQLIHFYSRDKFGGEVDDDAPKRIKKKSVNPKRKTNLINSELQEELWDLDHHLTDNHPGRLSICIGMPVMIKNNEAIECCVTNGAEAEVVG